MKIFSLIPLVIGLIALPSLAQDPDRVFDNFDTDIGVNVITPPKAPEQRMVRKKVNGKWVLVAEEKLVKKTAQVRPGGNVSDSYALRDWHAPKMVMGSSTNLKGFTTGNPVVDTYILESSLRYRIDPLLIYSQMHQESSFKQKAISHKGARGLMQLMPATARRFGVSNIFDPKQNIDAGVKYMRWLLDTFNGDLVLALAGYNAGEGAVMKYGWQVPPYRETREYVRRISGRYTLISNPQYLTSLSATQMEQKQPRPLSIYEPDVLTMRLPDGRYTLVNQ